MKKTGLLILSWSIVVLATAQRQPDWVKKAVVYQVYPSSFQDGDGDGIGDLRGIFTRLDYIQSLGVNVVYLNPIFRSAFKDGGYDVIDFYAVDPRFGSNTGLVELAAEIHRRGMHLVLDLVAGHSSNESNWFKQSMQGANLEYSDYYIWAPEKPKDLTPQEASHWVEANAPRAKFYIKNYYDIQPALNYGYAHPNPSHPWEQPVTAPGPQAVRRELQNIITFWLEKGVDGFRVDLASSLVKNDPDKSATISLWKDLSGWFDQKFPEGVLIAEWFNPKQSIPAGFDIDFLRPGKLTSAYERGQKTDAKIYFDKAGLGNASEWLRDFQEQYKSTIGKGYVSLPTGNHDARRMADSPRTGSTELKVLLTFLLTQPGVPFIYYGDEIGMRYVPNTPEIEGSRSRSGTRTPMQWDDGPNAGFSTAATDKIYLPLDPDPSRPTVAKEEKDKNSQLNYVRALLALRASSPALGNDGEWGLLSDSSQAYPMVYLRSHGKEQYVIAVNPSGRPVSAKLSIQGGSLFRYVFGTDSRSKCVVTKAGEMVSLPPISAAIFKIE